MDHLLPLHAESCTVAQLVIFDALIDYIHYNNTTPCDLIHLNTNIYCIFFSSTQNNTSAVKNSTLHNNTVPVGTGTFPPIMDHRDQYQAIGYSDSLSSPEEASLNMLILNPPYAADDVSQDFSSVQPMSPYRDIDNLSPSIIPAQHQDSWFNSGPSHSNEGALSESQSLFSHHGSADQPHLSPTPHYGGTSNKCLLGDTGRLEDDSLLGAVGGHQFQGSSTSQCSFGDYYSPPPQMGYQELLLDGPSSPLDAYEELSSDSSPTLTNSGASLFPAPSSSSANLQQYTHKGEARQRQPKQYRKDMTQEEFEEYRRAENKKRAKKFRDEKKRRKEEWEGQ